MWREGQGEEWLVLIKLVMGQEFMNGNRSLQGGLLEAESLRVESVGTVGEHVLGEAGRESLDAKIAEHGIRLPAAQEHDDIAVNISTEEGSGTTRAEGTGADEGRVNASGGFTGPGSVAQGVGDILGLDSRPGTKLRMGVVEGIQRSVGRGAMEAEMVDDETQ